MNKRTELIEYLISRGVQDAHEVLAEIIQRLAGDDWNVYDNWWVKDDKSLVKVAQDNARKMLGVYRTEETKTAPADDKSVELAENVMRAAGSRLEYYVSYSKQEIIDECAKGIASASARGREEGAKVTGETSEHYRQSLTTRKETKND